MKDITSSLEEYLKTMYILQKNKGNIRVTDVAKELDCTKPSVNRAIKLLKEQGYVNYEAYGDISFTNIGEKRAIEILKRHETIKAFLMQVLEVDEKKAESEAKNMKYAVSEETISKLEEYIKTVIDVNSLECNYDPNNEKCKKCVKITAKYRLGKK